MTWQEDTTVQAEQQILNLESEIARLTAALERRTEELAVANELDDEHRRHAEAFEQRVAELKETLRKILEPFPNVPMPKYEDIRRIARAALREGDEK